MGHGLAAVFGAVAVFAALFFLVMAVGKCAEHACGCGGCQTGERLARGTAYGTRNVAARMKLSPEDVALQRLLQRQQRQQQDAIRARRPAPGGDDDGDDGDDDARTKKDK